MPNKFSNLFNKSIQFIKTVKNCTDEIKKDFFEDMKEHYSYVTKTYTDIKAKDHKVIEISKDKLDNMSEQEIKETLENILESLNNKACDKIVDRNIADDTIGKCNKCNKDIESGDIYERSDSGKIYHEHCIH